MDNNGWTAAKVFRQPCSHDTCHSFNTSLSSSSAKWRTQWSRKRKNSFVGRLHFSEDHSMFVKLWIFFFFQNSFIKCPHLKCLIVPYCCVDYELHFFVNFCKMKKVKWAYQVICLLRKITPHTFLCYWKPGCQLLDLPFTSSPTPSRPRICNTKSLPSVLTL